MRILDRVVGLVVLGLSATAAASVAQAQAQAQGSGPGPIAERLRAEYLSREGFSLADANGDARLDRAEWLTRIWTVYRDHDADGDGRLSMEEFLDKDCGGLPPPHLDWCRNSARSYFRRDARRGFITRDTLAGRAGANFRFNDLDRDGFVTRAEELSASGVRQP